MTHDQANAQACKKCGATTNHMPLRSTGVRRLTHYAKIMAMVCTAGFVYPNAVTGDEMMVQCERCKTRVAVPYR